MLNFFSFPASPRLSNPLYILLILQKTVSDLRKAATDACQVRIKAAGHFGGMCTHRAMSKVKHLGPEPMPTPLDHTSHN